MKKPSFFENKATLILYILIFGSFFFQILQAAPPEPVLPAPDLTHKVKNFSKVIGWPKDKTPLAPQGFKVTRFAEGLKAPRWLYVAPNGDVFVSESKSNRITLLRGINAKGAAASKSIFLDNLNQPFGIAIIGETFFVANADAIWKFPYRPGEDKMTGKGERIFDLPSGGRHWTRNILSSVDGSKIYVAIGSASNVAEDGIDKEERRANILEINPDGTGEKVFAYGLRNPVGMAINPENNLLWTAVNERDDIGEDLVPDYMTEVKRGGFYGWPYAYFGQNPDPRLKGAQMDLVHLTLVPDLALGSHTASLGLTFYNQKMFPEKYFNGAFIGQHGSWNRSEFVGYKVAFVPFQKGKPTAAPEDFLTGFIAVAGKNDVYGRPVGVAVMYDGSLLVADDADVLLPNSAS